MEFTKFCMANPDQKTILIEEFFKNIKEICKKFQDDSGATSLEIIALLKDLASSWDSE